MAKVKVSKEVAEFIKVYEDGDSANWKDYIMAQHSQAWSKDYEEVTIKDRAKCLKNISPMKLAEMLINGYEVEKTPEDELLEYYKVHKFASQLPGAKQNADNCMRAIREVLTILGIEIDGINGK